jgi:6-phosphofructokinase 1
VVDVCLIPEVRFSLEKLLAYLGEVLDKKGNAVVCVAEGAGQVRGHVGVVCKAMLGRL